MNLKQKILHLCELYGVKTKKELGQNFLINPSIYELEIKTAAINEEDIVLDIGAGFGFLTERLASIAKKTYAVEIDPNIIRALKERLANLIEKGKLDVIQGDVLKIDFPNDITKIVSNPPYSISSDLIIKTIRELHKRNNFKLVVFILQKDFVERLLSKPCSKNWGRISATFNYYTNARYIRTISKRNFYPVPEVDSALIKYEFKKRETIIPIEKFEALSKHIFLGTNKTLRRVLKSYLKPLTRNWKEILNIISTKVDLNKRIRCVSPEDIEKIIEIIDEKDLLYDFKPANFNK